MRYQYALVDGKRQEAISGLKGICPDCRSPMIAKCGPKVVHHWAHHTQRKCDPWWENETDWHREWKNFFPAECREVLHRAPDGEFHRADILSPTGIYIEVQHSALTDIERLSRERFYKNLIWIVDGRSFRTNFHIHHPLPAPDAQVAEDIVWVRAALNMNGANAGLFFRLSEYRRDEDAMAQKADVRSGWVHALREIEAEVAREYIGHHQYVWKRPRQTWLEATCPVFIDFGGESVARLLKYDETHLPCIQFVQKAHLISSCMTETNVNALVARGFG